MTYDNANDLVAAIAKRARVLGDMKMDDLRSTNGYGCNTRWEALQKDKYKTRGQVIEEILIEEFWEEFPKELTDA